MGHRSQLAFALIALLGLTGHAMAQTPAPAAPPPQPAPQPPTTAPATPPPSGTPAAPPPSAAPAPTAPTPTPAEGVPAPQPGAPAPTAPETGAPVPELAPTAEPAPAAEPAPVFEGDATATPEAVFSEDTGIEGEIVGTESTASTGNINEEMIVTGTRIRLKTAFAPSAPVDVIDRKSLEYRGATSLADVVQYMSVSQGSGSDGDAAGPGTASVNLRGLGPGATLTLINGRRMHYSGGGIAEPFGDISVIPMSAVERVEILKGGSSAIYGSDAVAGVVNVITRKNWDGARFELSGQGTEDIDYSGWAGNASFGATSEKARLLGAIQYGFTSELTAGEVEWTEGRYWNSLGYPGSYIVGVGAQPDPQCEDGPRSREQEIYSYVGEDLVRTPSGSLCQLDTRNGTSLQGRGERATALMTAEYDVTNHTTVFAEALISRLRGDGSSNAFGLPLRPIVPADHPDNPFGQDVRLIGRFPGVNRSTADDDTFRGVIGLKGDLEGAAEDTFLEAWEWEVYGSFGISRYRNLFNDHIASNVQEALNGCSDFSEDTPCLNPFQSANDGTGTPNSQAVLDYIRGQMEVLNDHGLQTYNAGMSGPLVELPGGDLALAFGAEIRHEFRSSELDHTANQFDYAFLVGNTDAKASRDVYSGYLEARWPFFDGFELQTAGRLERYTDIERNAISPSAGLTLIPSEMIGRDQTPSAFRKLQFRLHGTRAFRAPTIFQSFPGQATVPSGIILEGDTSPTFIPVTYSGNPDLIEEKAWAFSAGLAWQPVDEIGLTSDFWWYDYRDKIFQYTPSQILADEAQGMLEPGTAVIRGDDGAIQRILSRQINVPEPINTYGLDFGVMFSLTGKTFGGSENDWGKIGLGAQGTWTWSYAIPFERASSRLLPNGERLDPVDCDGDSCEVAGKRNDTNFAPPIPVLKMNIPVTYENNGHNIAIIPRFVSGVQDDAVLPMSGELGEVPPWMTIDAMYSYTLKELIGSELTLRVGVINLLDTPPPDTNPGTKLNATAYEPLLYDPRGRVFYAGAVSQF